MGLDGFWQLFKDGEYLASSIVHEDGRPDVTARTDVVFVDTAFLLTTGSLKLGTSQSFVYYNGHVDQAVIDNMPPHTHLPLTLDDYVTYVIEFIKRIVLTRPSVRHIIFGVDNHAHVPFTKRVTWHNRDFGHGTIHEPYSRSDKTAHFELIAAMQANTPENRRAPLGKSIAFTSNLLEAVLTDRYTRPLFISMLFRAVGERIMNNEIKAKDQLSVFVMHQVVDFASAQTMPNNWTLTSNPQNSIVATQCNDGLTIGEADIQMLWVLHSLRTHRYNIEVFSDDSDNIMITLLHMCHMNRTSRTTNNIYLWKSDTEIVDIVKTYRHIPQIFSHVNAGLGTSPELDTTRHWCLKFVELCMLVYKTDYYKNIMGVTSSTPSLVRVIKYMSKIPRKAIVTNGIKFEYDGNDVYPTSVVFDHKHLMDMHYYVIKLARMTSEKEAGKILSVVVPNDIDNDMLDNSWEEFIAGINKGARGNADGQFKYLADLFKIPEVKSQLRELISIEQFISFAQVHACKYADNIYPFESDHTGVIRVKSKGVDVEVALFLSTREMSDTPKWSIRQVGDQNVQYPSIVLPDTVNDDTLALSRERARDFGALFDLRTVNKYVFPGELTNNARRMRSAMIEWAVCYWTWGYGRIFDPAHVVASEHKPTGHMTVSGNGDVLIIGQMQHLNDLLIFAGFKVEYDANDGCTPTSVTWPRKDESSFADIISVEFEYTVTGDNSHKPVNFGSLLRAANINPYPVIKDATSGIIASMIDGIKTMHGVRAVSILSKCTDVLCDVVRSFCKNALVCTMDNHIFTLYANSSLLFIKHAAAYIMNQDRVLESLDNITVTRTPTNVIFIPVVYQRRIYPLATTSMSTMLPSTYQFAQIPHIKLAPDDAGRDGKTPVYREVLCVNDTGVTSGITSSVDRKDDATLLYYKALSYMTPNNGRVVEQHGAPHAVYEPLTVYASASMYATQSTHILSGSPDVCSYALPLLGANVNQHTWNTRIVPIIYVFRSCMEVGFQSAMEFKIVEAMYLEWLVNSNIRKTHDIKWLVTYAMQKPRTYTFFAREFLNVYMQNPYCTYAGRNVDISKCVVPIITLGAVPSEAALTWPMAALLSKKLISTVTTGTTEPDGEQIENFMQKINTATVLTTLSRILPNIQGMHCVLSGMDSDDNVIAVDLYFDKWPKHIFFLYVYKAIADMYMQLDNEDADIVDFYSAPYVYISAPGRIVFKCNVAFNYVTKMATLN